MKALIEEIRNCQICHEHLALGPNPIFSITARSSILLIGQAPGKKVHESGIPWKDLSGIQLRKWLGVKDDVFYDPNNFGIVPMGFCYPGKGSSGDLQPRAECAPTWHQKLISRLHKVQLTLLIGQYAQNYYLGSTKKKNLTETVKSYQEYLPRFLPLPHPSPRNRFWLIKNPWFEQDLLPELRRRVHDILEH